MNHKIMSIVIVALFICAGVANFAPPVSASDGWLDHSWTARRSMIIDNTQNPNTLLNYQVKINVAYDTSMKHNI